MVNWGYYVLDRVSSFSCLTLPPKTFESFTINSIKSLFCWNLILSVTYLPEDRGLGQLHLEAGQQKICTVTVSGSEWPVTAPAWDGKEGSAQAEARSRGCLVVPWRCPLWPLSSPISQGERPRQAGARAREDGRTGGRGWNGAVCALPAVIGDGAKASSCISSWRGSCFRAHPHAHWGRKKYPHMQMRMPESTSAAVPGSSGSPHKQWWFICSPNIYLLSGEEGWALAGQQSGEINRRFTELIMSCGTIPCFVTRWKVAQSIKQPSNHPVPGWPQWK